eukprot:8896438-Alexandrium_andersonii.AAC.1
MEVCRVVGVWVRTCAYVCVGVWAFVGMWVCGEVPVCMSACLAPLCTCVRVCAHACAGGVHAHVLVRARPSEPACVRACAC